jgi:hypothetical protein
MLRTRVRGVQRGELQTSLYGFRGLPWFGTAALELPAHQIRRVAPARVGDLGLHLLGLILIRAVELRVRAGAVRLPVPLRGEGP